VPGAYVVMDLLVWRSRGGELSEVDADDDFILEGNYFARIPTPCARRRPRAPWSPRRRALKEGEGKKPWRYKVVGDFKGLPALEERPLCISCQLGPIT
jgi:hypothetical protein